MADAMAKRADGVHVRGADGLLYFVPSDSGVPKQVDDPSSEARIDHEAASLKSRGEQDGSSSALFIDPGDGPSSNLFIDPGDAASSALFIDGASSTLFIDPGDAQSSALFIDGASSTLFIEPSTGSTKKLPA